MLTLMCTLIEGELWGVEQEEHEDESKDDAELNLAMMPILSVCQNLMHSLCRHLASHQHCCTAHESEPDSGKVKDEAEMPFRSLLVGSRHQQEEDGIVFWPGFLFFQHVCILPSRKHY